MKESAFGDAMKQLLQRVLKTVAYFAAALVILLAVAVGLFRLLLPKLPEYQEEIKDWARAAIGLQVDFTGMNARWSLSGPELNFYNAELRVPGAAGGAFSAEEVSVGVGFLRLLVDRTLVVDRLLVRESEVDIRQNENGAWTAQGIPFGELAGRFTGEQTGGEIAVIAEDIEVGYVHPANGQIVIVGLDTFNLRQRDGAMNIAASVDLPESLGGRLQFRAGRRPAQTGGRTLWNFGIDARDLRLAGWSGLQPAAWPALTAGIADVSLSLQRSGSRITNATASFTVEDLAVVDSEDPLGAEGQIEYAGDAAGWFVEADGFRLRSVNGIWPETSVSVSGGNNTEGALQTLQLRAGYLNLDDAGALRAWLPGEIDAALDRYRPSGSVRDLDATLSDLDRERPRYDVAMELSEAGLRQGPEQPDIRGFSGSLRANRSGGRVEIDAAAMTLDLDPWLAETVSLESARGTVIWRRNRDGITVLSDSIVVQNEDLTSRNSLQLTLPAGDGSPVLDLESRWSVYNLGAARRYLPLGVMNPALYRWLSDALQGGRVPLGTTRLSGPLDRFPFDGGEGVFRIEARLEEATLRYSDKWPDVENMNLDLVVDGMRLYSTRNTATSAGNSVADAAIEIADLRQPVLTIDALATGTMASIRRFARQSPIAELFGGQLERVNVAGDASFTLDLRYPILRREEYAFTTRIRMNDATLRIRGLDPPFMGLNGVVHVERREIRSETLVGRVLGAPITIDLRAAGDAEPGHSVIANIDGTVTPAGLEAGFGAAFGGVLEGEAGYRASVFFPRADESAAPLLITVDSTLEGLGVSLPEPAGKPPRERRPLALSIEFPGEGRIESRGGLGEDFRWTLNFERGANGWDFDRGMLAVGGAYPGDAETRGLHIVGQTPVLRLRDWLTAAAGDDEAEAGDGGVADRIRSIDLRLQDLYVFGQHFGEHRVVVDRSANDWVVRVSGEQAAGTVSIPYDLSGERPLGFDMQRMILPGSDDEDGESPLGSDPRRLPPLSLEAEEFAFGERYLGAVRAEFARTGDGLVSEDVRAEDASFSLRGRAGWVIDTSEPSGQKSFVTATLGSSDIGATMQRLNSAPGIVGEDMEITVDVNWSGPPREDFLESLDGNVAVRFGTGRLDEVEPGAGRVFGLMSVAALPRRLALDFRDVLDKGFAFDEITGNFRLEGGMAYTCDLSLKGPAADVGIVGRADLVAREYEQTALVSANVGNTLPVVGAVVAGPQVAAALLIFSQIFKKPLQEMGQVYYAIDGTWDDPDVDTASARRFADSSQLAGCLRNAE